MSDHTVADDRDRRPIDAIERQRDRLLDLESDVQTMRSRIDSAKADLDEAFVNFQEAVPERDRGVEHLRDLESFLNDDAQS